MRAIYKLLLLPARVTLPGVGVGIVSGMALRKYGRPLLVGTVRNTMKLWHEAKGEAEEVRSEARVGLAAPTTSTTKTTTTRVD